MTWRFDQVAVAPDVERRGAGFTLIELLISLTVLGMIMTVLAFATITVIRTVPSTEQHVDDARSLRALSTWLAQDAMSTLTRDVTPVGAWSPPADPRGFDTHPDNPGLCGVTSETDDLDTSVVQLAWLEDTGSTTTAYVADYRYESSPDERAIVRVSCQGSDFNNLGSPEVLRLTETLQSIDVASYSETLNQLVIRLSGESGTLIAVEVASRNPGTV